MVDIGDTPESVRLHIVQRDEGVKLTLEDFGRHLAGYRDLLTLASLLEIAEQNQTVTARRELGTARHAADKFVVEKLNYNSPIDIIVAATTTIGMIVGGGYAVANRVMTLQEKYHKLRETKSNVTVRIAQNNKLLEELELDRYQLDEFGERDRHTKLALNRDRDAEQIAQVVESSVNTLEGTAKLEILPATV